MEVMSGRLEGAHDGVEGGPLHIAQARAWWQRLLGLMGRTRLPVGDCLAIAPCNAIHTFFMRMTIDVAFLDEQGRVLKTRYDLMPWRASLCLGAAIVLEFPAGGLDRFGVREGSRLVWD